MKAIEVSPQPYHLTGDSWVLLQDQAGVPHLLVYCTQSAASYAVLLKLSAEELREYHGLGWLTLQHLAHRVNYFASEYSDRAIRGVLLDQAISVAGFRVL